MNRFGTGHSFIESSKSVLGYFEHLSFWHYIALVLVLIVVLLSILYFTVPDFNTYVTTKWSEGFRQSGSSSELASQDVLFFYSETCKHCQNMISVLNKEGSMKSVTPVDVGSESGKQLVEKYNVKQGIPAFVSLKNNTMSVGYKPTTAEVVAELKAPSNAIQEPAAPIDESDLKNVVNSLDIVLFKTSTCGHCKRALEHLQELNKNYGAAVTVYDLNSPEGAAAFKSSGLPSTGVPIYWSRQTGKSSVGFKPFAETIKTLQS